MNLVCPHCLKTNDRHGRISRAGERGPAQPKPGSFSICATCLQLSVMTNHMALRKATDEELAELEADPMYAALKKVREDLEKR